MTTTTKHLPADERKAITVVTVIELAALRNPGEITTAAIAQQMGLTQGALFRHFPSKDTIWLAVMEWVAGQLLTRVEQGAGNTTTATAALDAIFTAHLDLIITYPGIPRILFHELQRAENTPAKGVVRALITEYREQLLTILERGKINGELANDINVSAAAALFLGMTQGLVMQSLISGDPEHLNRMSPEVFTLYLRSIRKIL